jgi:hypothetical protein
MEGDGPSADAGIGAAAGGGVLDAQLAEPRELVEYVGLGRLG